MHCVLVQVLLLHLSTSFTELPMPLQSVGDGDELRGINVMLLLNLLYPLRLACAGGKILLSELGPDIQTSSSSSGRPMIVGQLYGEQAYW